MGVVKQILHLPENVFYQTIYHFQVSWAASASAFLDSALIYGQSATPRLAEHLSITRLFSTIVNGGWLACEAIELFRALQGKNIFLFTNTISGAPWVEHLGQVAKKIFEIVPIQIILGAGSAALSFVGSKFYRAVFPARSPEALYAPISTEERKWVALSLSSQPSQAFSSVIYFARIVANLPIVYFFPQRRLWCILNIATLSYSLMKTTQLKWLNFSRSFEFPVKDAVKKVIITYSLPLLPNVGRGQQCVIGLEDNPPYCFSPQSPMDLDCLIGYICMASKKFLDRWDWSTFKVTHKMNRTVTRTTYQAKITLSQANLPRCPVTRIHPSSHVVKAQFWDHDASKGEFETTVSLTPDTTASTVQPLLSETFLTRLGAVYTAFAAGLAMMQQRYPELLKKIVSAQKILSVLDLGVLLCNYYQLYRIFYDRYVAFNVQQLTPQDRVTRTQTRLESARLECSRLQTAIDKAIEAKKITRNDNNDLLPQSVDAEALIDQYNLSLREFADALNEHEAALTEQISTRTSLEKKYLTYLLIAMGVGVVGLSVISALVASLLTKLPRPAYDKKIGWGVPWMRYGTQSIFVSRIVMDLSLAYFSPDRFSHLFSALFQSVTLWNLAKLPQIKTE